MSNHPNPVLFGAATPLPAKAIVPQNPVFVPASEMGPSDPVTIVDEPYAEVLVFDDSYAEIIARDEAEVSEEMSEKEIAKRKKYEGRIKRAYFKAYEAGYYLMKIRDGKLYRNTHPTFEAYVEEVWGHKRSRASQLIHFAHDQAMIRVHFKGVMPEKTAEEIEALMPKTESHTRPMKGLSDEQKALLWRELVAKKDPDTITAVDVASIRQEKMPATPKTRKTKAAEPESPVHVVASVKGGKVEIQAEPANPEDEYTLELTVAGSSLKEIRAALRRVAGKELSAALKGKQK